MAVRTSSNPVFANTDYIGAPGTSIGVLLQTPIRFIFYLLSPLPWQVISRGTFIAMILDSTIRWICFYRITKLSIIKKDKLLLEYKEKMVIGASLVIILSTTLIFAWGTNNYGTAMRHRTGMYPIEVLLFYTIWTKAKERY